MRKILAPFALALAATSWAQTSGPPIPLAIDGAGVSASFAQGQIVKFSGTLQQGQTYAILGSQAIDASVVTPRFPYPYDMMITDPSGNTVNWGYQNFFEATLGAFPYTGAMYFTAPATGTYTFDVFADAPTEPYTLDISLKSAGAFATYWNHANFASPTMQNLWDKEVAEPGAMDAYYSGRIGLGPIVEAYPGDANSVYVTFLYKAAPTDSQIVLYGPTDSDTLNRFGATDIYYQTRRLPKTAYFVYAFGANKKADIPGPLPFYRNLTATSDYYSGGDPLNPGTSTSFSTLALPGATFAPELSPMSVPSGTIVDATFSSTALGEDRPYHVYLPYGYAATKASLPVVVVYDGNHSVGPNDGLPISSVLDNLIAGRRIPPMVAVFVDNLNPDRSRDLRASPSFASFVAQELLPAVRANYRVTTSATRTMVAGFSYGGLQAAYTALQYPGTFGNALCMSPSFWANRATPEDVEPSPESDVEPLLMDPSVRTSGLRFFMGYGLYEQSIQLPTRHMRDLVRLQGLPIGWKEYPSNHNSLNEGNEFVDGLLSLTNSW